MGRIRQQIETKLTAAFEPTLLTIEDESHLHKGHGGYRPEGESHFRLHIVSDAFIGKRPLQRHRMVNEVLAEELRDHIHALAIRAEAPGET
jgi:BolA protein